MAAQFPVDPRAPARGGKRFPDLPWRCQTMCPAQPGEGCKGGEGSCTPDFADPPGKAPLLRHGGCTQGYTGGGVVPVQPRQTQATHREHPVNQGVPR